MPASINGSLTGAGFAPGTKRITPLSTSEVPGGSRVVITSDAPLSDCRSYRDGQSFYVVIPQGEMIASQGPLKGRGFAGPDVERRGQDLLLTFRLEPGVSASVSQKFNRLLIVFTAPGLTD
ncbi:MAG TPA: hypothetical protein VF507_07650, partial [Pyrinomonadaceae bacterium]